MVSASLVNSLGYRFRSPGAEMPQGRSRRRQSQRAVARRHARSTHLIPVSVHCSWLDILQGTIARGITMR